MGLRATPAAGQDAALLPPADTSPHNKQGANDTFLLSRCHAPGVRPIIHLTYMNILLEGWQRTNARMLHNGSDK